MICAACGVLPALQGIGLAGNQALHKGLSSLMSQELVRVLQADDSLLYIDFDRRASASANLWPAKHKRKMAKTMTAACWTACQSWAATWRSAMQALMHTWQRCGASKMAPCMLGSTLRAVSLWTRIDALHNITE